MIPEEKAVVDAAIEAHCYNGTTSLSGCAPEWCGGSGLDPCRLHGAVERLLAARAAPVWHPATFMDVLAGDRIRLGQDEATVLRCNAGIWHADTSNAWQPKSWPHTELRMELDVVPGFQQYPPNTPCEILASPERLAVLRVQQAFPGTNVTDRGMASTWPGMEPL